ncbi:ABC transporter ATP-binding protein, partial [Flavonifractor plautii]|nr:ABC transporter ATP-binding protein [Flavonifractor plautii]
AVTAVCAVEGRRLTKYPGNYAAYQAKKECLEGEHLRQDTAQQREIARTETYIRKNRAGRNAKMARGRQKRLDRLERLAAPDGRSAPQVFEFQPLPAGRTGD